MAYKPKTGIANTGSVHPPLDNLWDNLHHTVYYVKNAILPDVLRSEFHVSSRSETVVPSVRRHHALLYDTKMAVIFAAVVVLIIILYQWLFAIARFGVRRHDIEGPVRVDPATCVRALHPV